jgi:hypothetical protein
MKQKAIEAARFLETIRTECRIVNSQNLALTGKENDLLRDAVECLISFTLHADIPKPDGEAKSD